MSGRIAFTDAAIYLGGGEAIERGFVVLNGGVIEEIGRSGDLKKTSDLEVIDLPGRLVLPGLADCHVHLVGYALTLAGLDLSMTDSLEEGLRVIARHLKGKKKGAWLRGRGWDKQRWGLSGFPTKDVLDAIAPDNPVALTSRDGHLEWVNSVVLRMLGLDRVAFDVDGGEIEVDHVGRPTGILKENAAGLVDKQAGDEEEQEASAAVGLASRELIRLGLTCVHSVEEQRDARVVDLAVEQGCVDLGLVRLREVSDIRGLKDLSPSPQVSCIKVYADGALGSQTASMFEPYCGQPGNLGITVTAEDDLHDVVRRSVEMGFSVAVHAIGDRANKEVLDVYERVRREVPRDDVVLRVEHAQILRSEDISRFGRLGVVASMQPIHIVADMRVAEAYWGPRCRNAYACKSILNAGGTLAFGSDAPIEDPDPLKGIHAAVTRRDPEARTSSAWYGDERLTITEAIDCYTQGAAVAGGRSDMSGRIAPGVRADLTILDRDILASGEPDSLLDTSIEMTIIGGEVHTIR